MSAGNVFGVIIAGAITTASIFFKNFLAARTSRYQLVY
jgi:hypothetical protein